MDKYNNNNKWEKIYQNYKLYFPVIESITVDWWPAGYEKITVVLKDGMRMIYDDVNQNIRNIDAAKENLEDEEGWSREFSRRLRAKMIDNCYDQELLARATGISTGSMSNYLTGKTLPNVWVLNKIAKVLNSRIEEFFYFE